jgi:ABC-type polysaccharide/polyol phosphate export permease
MLCTLLSFVFSAGALFVLSWNASVVGTAVGSLIAKLQGAGSVAGVALAQGLTLGTVFYMLHLIPEVVAYFYASVAGAFISSAMLRYEPFSKPSNRLLALAVAFTGVAIALILLGAVIETQISHRIQVALRV